MTKKQTILFFSCVFFLFFIIFGNSFAYVNFTQQTEISEYGQEYEMITIENLIDPLFSNTEFNVFCVDLETHNKQLIIEAEIDEDGVFQTLSSRDFELLPECHLFELVINKDNWEKAQLFLEIPDEETILEVLVNEITLSSSLFESEWVAVARDKEMEVTIKEMEVNELLNMEVKSLEVSTNIKTEPITIKREMEIEPPIIVILGKPETLIEFSIKTIPEEAEVYVNDQYLGNTPFERTIPMNDLLITTDGLCIIRLNKAGYEEEMKEIDLFSDENREKDVIFITGEFELKQVQP